MKRGPRSKSGEARESIVEAAKELFTESGYDSTSMRAIATKADVDPALVHYYFKSKNELFVATLQLPVTPPEIIASLLEGDRDEIGDRLVRRLLLVWDNPETGGPLVSILRSGASMDGVLREFVELQIRPLLAGAIQGPDGDLRATAAITQILGLVMTRYVFRIEPVASASHDELADLIGPTIQSYLGD